MLDPHENPAHIITSYLAITSIVVSHEDDTVKIFGLYGNLVDPGMPTIEFHLTFYQLNELLSAITQQADNAIDQIAKALTEPQDDHSVINVTKEGGLHFDEHLFAFQVVYEEDENGHVTITDEPSYLMVGYMPLNGMLPNYIDTPFPMFAEYLLHLNKVQAAKYSLYLHFSLGMDHNEALVSSNLTDPLSFALAKEYYELFYQQGKPND